MTDTDVADLAFWRTVNHIQCPADAKIAAWRQYGLAFDSGDPRREHDAILHTIGAMPWRWPVFERWRQRFAETGEWPYMWHSLGLDTRQHNSDLCKLLAHTISMTAYGLRRHGQLLERLADVPGSVAQLVFIDCPVEQRIGAEKWRGIDGPQPPYFPGDRTRVRVITPRRQR